MINNACAGLGVSQLVTTGLFPLPTYLKPASILLYEIVVHGTDHPLVFIQDLCLEAEYGHTVSLFISPFLQDRVKISNMTLRRSTGCMLISQPVFSPGSFILSKPNRASISSVNWLRSRRLTADMEDPSSLVQTHITTNNKLMASFCHLLICLTRVNSN